MSLWGYWQGIEKRIAILVENSTHSCLKLGSGGSMGLETRKKRLLLHMKINKEKEKKCSLLPNRSFFNFFGVIAFILLIVLQWLFIFCFLKTFLTKSSKTQKLFTRSWWRAPYWSNYCTLFEEQSEMVIIQQCFGSAQPNNFFGDYYSYRKVKFTPKLSFVGGSKGKCSLFILTPGWKFKFDSRF